MENTYACELMDGPAQPALVVRTRTPVDGLPGVMGQALGAVAQYLAEQGVEPAGAPFTAYFNMDMQDLDVAIGFPLAQPLDGQAQIEPYEIPGKLAACLYTGPYEQLTKPYEALAAWIEAQGLEPSGIAIEQYLNSPMEVAPEELQTRILFVLK